MEFKKEEILASGLSCKIQVCKDHYLVVAMPASLQKPEGHGAACHKKQTSLPTLSGSPCSWENLCTTMGRMNRCASKTEGDSTPVAPVGVKGQALPPGILPPAASPHCWTLWTFEGKVFFFQKKNLYIQSVLIICKTRYL